MKWKQFQRRFVGIANIVETLNLQKAILRITIAYEIKVNVKHDTLNLHSK